VSVVSQLMYKIFLLGIPQRISPGPHVKDQELNPRPHTPRLAALPVKVEQWVHPGKGLPAQHGNVSEAKVQSAEEEEGKLAVLSPKAPPGGGGGSVPPR